MFDYKKAYENLLQKYKQQELEINRLRTQLAEFIKDPIPPVPTVQEVMDGEVHRGSSSDQKLELFRELFHGRRDVFAVRWENEKTGKTGYSPSCENNFDRFLCHKPKVKCSECQYQKFHPFTQEVIRDHIQGKKTIGIYPMLLDETCTFLVIDLDKSGWSEDAKAIRNTCLELEIFPAIERSRSGNGAHVWIFFEEPVSAAIARNLGTLILTRTMKKYRLSMDSYDRFFPNQDTLPRGGFGNLIALPFQGNPSSQGNSLFLNESMEPYEDQWLFLSRIKQLSIKKVEALVTKATDTGKLFDLGRFDHVNQESVEEPWKNIKPVQQTLVSGPHPDSVRMVLSNQIYIEKKGLSPALIHRLVSLASFQNPEFYQTQAMRFSTYGIPRVICTAEEYPQHQHK